MTEEDDGGGRMLPHYTLGPSVSASYGLTDKLSLGSSMSYTRVYTEKSQFNNEQRALNISEPPNHSYSIGFSASYSILSNWSASLSYSQGDRIEKYGRVEFVPFDPAERVERWALGTSVSF